ncbi:hypothetical protein CHU95_19125 [Niveispirillum lacus]|uniref:Formyl transferase N-terminal domain-containing protein n=1 Tax=Niveispirillum lacus TaxID=1981099 RepID=A0A255YUF5_9PROT|nr:formyltransferase family protein [Niveispirillum lacus]OYQ32853.1 hypothetical protein CHU95_19125 [Niveispirillum lacus]
MDLALPPPDQVILATGAGLVSILKPLFPDATVVTDLSQLDTVLKSSGQRSIRLISVGFGHIIPAWMLDLCSAGAINFHPATPDYPGSASNHLALYEGAQRFGVTAHITTAAVDAGPILAVRYFDIPPGIGHRSLDELTFPCLLSLVGELAPCFYGHRPFPPRPSQSWRGPARRRSDILLLAQITPDMPPTEQRRRWQAFHEGPDSILTYTQAGHRQPYSAGGRTRGWVDGIIGNSIHGWAYDPGRPPVTVRIEVDGRPFRNLLADEYRGDVAAAGQGDGLCGFSIKTSDLPTGAERIDFLIPSDEWCRIPGAPLTLPA